MTGRVRDRVFLITGAASGLGKALAKEILARGGMTALADKDDEALGAAVEELKAPGRIVSTHRLDVTDAEAWPGVIADVLDRHGCLDALINNAGIGSTPQSFLEFSPDFFERVLRVNALGAVYAARNCLPELTRSSAGGIINISSTSGLLGLSGYTAYSMSKAALGSLGESLAMEFAGTSLKVLNVYPGGIKTNLMRNAENLDPKRAEQVHSGFQRSAALTPKRAARRIVSAYARGKKKKILLGPDTPFILALSRLPGSLGLKMLKYFFAVDFARFAQTKT